LAAVSPASAAAWPASAAEFPPAPGNGFSFPRPFLSCPRSFFMARRVLLLAVLPVLAALTLTWSPAADKPPAPPEPQPAVKTEPTLSDHLAHRIDFAGLDGPNVTLREALDMLAKESGLAFDVNEAAFRDEMIENVLSQTIGDRPIPKMKHVSVERVLHKVLARIPSPSGATFLVRREALEITTGAALAAEVWPKDYQGPRLPLVHAAFDRKPLSEALRELARQSGMNVVVDARATEKAKVPVSARLLNTPLDTAVRLLADMADLKPFSLDNLLYVTMRENADRLEERLRLKGTADAPDEIDGGPYRVGSGPGVRPNRGNGGM